jgi:prepilin-type N-terminal cleavage/methylation domain-containing protein
MFPRSNVRSNPLRTSGHTLMELIVVMAVLGISASLLLPITVRSYARFKLRLAADSIVRLMQQAKGRALFEGRTYLVIFPDPAAQEREITLAREDGVAVGHYTFPIDVSLESRKADGDWSTDIGLTAFYPDGTSEAMQLALKNASSSTTHIELDPMTARPKIVLVDEVQP